MKSRKSVKAKLTMPDQEPAQALIAKLSPEGRRRYVDLILAQDFSAFVTKEIALWSEAVRVAGVGLQ